MYCRYFDCGKDLCWSQVPVIPINYYPWGSDYTPEAAAQLCYVKDVGFYCRLSCKETDPKTTYTQFGDPVYKDSCLEFFANYCPNQNPSYINCEVNSAGTVLAEYGAGRQNRVLVSNLSDTIPHAVCREAGDTFWQVTLQIPLDMLKKIYGKSEFCPGEFILANFYKCGDETAIPHFGSAFPIQAETPNFHCPEFFQKIILKK